MPRAYGITNAAPYASAPAVGAAGDTYWNTTTKLLYVSDGSGWVAAEPYWSVAGATLTPTDTAKGLALAPINNPLQWGSGTVKGRLVYPSAGLAIEMTANASQAGVEDDATKAAWRLKLDPQVDQFGVSRQPVGSSTPTNLVLVGSSGGMTIYGPASGTDPSQLTIGTRTIRGHLHALYGLDFCYFAINDVFNGSAWTRDDATKAGWRVVMRLDIDQFAVERTNAAGADTQPLILDNAGNLTILGSTAIKASGTTWANPSDPRLKDDIASYARGLADVVQLEPITYRLKADPEGPPCYGFDAAKIRPVFPECVTETTMKLAPDDAEPTAGVLSFDMHPIVVALVNAVKELAARVAALEAATAPHA